MSIPLFSIAVANYQYAPYVEKALSSIEEQTFPDWEVGIIDDGSTDESADLIRRFLEKSSILRNHCFLWKIHSENQGVCRTRNEIFNQASGRYFLYLDSDDYFYPDFLERMSRFLKRYRYPDLVQFSEDLLDDKTGEIKSGRYFPIRSVVDLIYPHSRSLNYLVEKSLFTSLDGYDEQFSEGWEDWDFALRAVTRSLHFRASRIRGLVWRINKQSRSIQAQYLPYDRYFELVRKLFARCPELAMLGFREFIPEPRRELFCREVLHVYPEDLYPEFPPSFHGMTTTWNEFRFRPRLIRFPRKSSVEIPRV